MTFSVAFYDQETKSWGVGVASKFLAVGSVVPWAKAGVGAVATQAYSNYSYGPRGLELLAEKDAVQVVKALTSSDSHSEIRQLGVVDSNGNSAAHTGSKCMDYAGHITGDGFTVQGNILASSEVIESMAKEMERGGPLLERIIRTLEVAESKGGDRRGRQSAAILIATESTPFEEFSDRFLDLRVDDSDNPLKEIRRMSVLWEATFYDFEMVSIKEHEEEISRALSKTKYGDIKEWANNNNFDQRVTGDSVSKKVLEALLTGARNSW